MKKKIALIVIFSLLTIWIGFRTDIDIGRCCDNSGNGKVYNGEPYYNYIYYDETKISQNDIVLTIFILNPLNTYVDDIIFRYDKSLLKNTEPGGST